MVQTEIVIEAENGVWVGMVEDIEGDVDAEMHGGYPTCVSSTIRVQIDGELLRGDCVK